MVQSYVCVPGVQSVSKQGAVRIVFKRRIRNLDAETLDLLVESSLIQIDFQPGSDSLVEEGGELSDVSFTWNITDTFVNGFTIQIYWSDASKISRTSSSRDQVLVAYKGVDDFLWCKDDPNKKIIEKAADRRRLQDAEEEEEVSMIDSIPLGYQLSINLPPQLPFGIFDSRE